MNKFQAIRCALIIRKYGKISSAADVLYMSQPNLSRTLAALENELGFSLFYRSKSGMTITSQGESYLMRAENLMEELDSIEKKCRFEQISKVRIAAVASSLYINHILDTMQKYPEISIEFTENESEEVMNQTAEDKVDFGLVIIPYSQRQNYEKCISSHRLVYAPISRSSYYLLTNCRNPYFKEAVAPDLNNLRHCILSSTQQAWGIKDSLLCEYLPKECKVMERNARSSNMDFLDTFSNGVMITFQTHKRILERNNLISIPLRQLPLEIEYAYVCKKGKRMEKESLRILKNLCKDVKIELCETTI